MRSSSAQYRLRVAVQPREGFIEQVNVRALRHRPSEKRPLLLAARERADLPVGEIGQPRGRERLLDEPGGPPRRNASTHPSAG